MPNKRTVTVDTLYPFGQMLQYKIEASAPFTFYIRIPGWEKSGSYLNINGGRASALSPELKTSLQAVNIHEVETIVELYLDMEIEVEERSNGSIAVHRGPLFYAVDLAYEDVVKPALRCARCLVSFRGRRGSEVALKHRSPGPLRFISNIPGVPDVDLLPVSLFIFACEFMLLTMSLVVRQPHARSLLEPNGALEHCY